MQSCPEPPPPEQPKSSDFINLACDDPGFTIMSLTPLMGEYTYGGCSQRSHSTVSSELSSTSPTSDPTVLTALPMSKISEKNNSGALQCSHSGPQSSYHVSARRSMRYTPFSGVPSHSSRGRKGRLTKHKDSTNTAGSSGPVQNRAASHALRFQEIRRLHVGPEQQRRNELRASYHRLKNAVPTHGIDLMSHPRPTKIALLDRAATRINSLEMSRQQLLAKIQEVEEEAARLRQANEELALSPVSQRSAAASTPP
ncbi:hypothetical protein V8E53_003180 [Lactarius tabidus]